ncbi:Hypothetical predicted protein [Mytilus galloprovincialis]|uniref:Sushi domain-containing protein n=1 Tax=Mytilus galloprovincialis TaxID=29158 RepID=A0A8B6CK46_MYTGA|nr:Hypothetical predicted protein [Mytilus galloprovincialis]
MEWIYNYVRPDNNQPVTTTLQFRNTVLPQQSSMSVNVLGTIMDAWTCISNLTLSDTDSVAVFKSDTSHSDGPFSGQRWLYLCMKFTKVTDNLFYFYLLSDVDKTVFPNERVFNPPANSVPANTDPLCSTFCQHSTLPNRRTLRKKGTTDVMPSDARLCTPCESPCEEQIVTCPGLVDETFAKITTRAGSNYQNTITYACITGYEWSSGSLARQCLADGIWNGSHPVCEIVTCRGLAKVNFARITSQTGKNYEDTITYACIKGYKSKHGNRLTRTCRADGTWNNHPPICKKSHGYGYCNHCCRSHRSHRRRSHPRHMSRRSRSHRSSQSRSSQSSQSRSSQSSQSRSHRRSRSRSYRSHQSHRNRRSQR